MLYALSAKREELLVKPGRYWHSLSGLNFTASNTVSPILQLSPWIISLLLLEQDLAWFEFLGNVRRQRHYLLDGASPRRIDLTCSHAIASVLVVVAHVEVSLQVTLSQLPLLCLNFGDLQRVLQLAEHIDLLPRGRLIAYLYGAFILNG